jgi:hypothetical protein
MGHSRKHPYLPHGVNWKLTPNTLTIIRNNLFSPPPSDGGNFLCGGSVDLFWNDPMQRRIFIFSFGGWINIWGGGAAACFGRVATPGKAKEKV